MYAKLIEGVIFFAPRKIKYNGYTYFNPKPAILEAAGFKPVIFTEQPGPEYVETWTETDDAIIQGWVEPAEEETVL